MSAGAKLGVPSGVGLVVANMVGAGVFLSAGFMAQDLRPLEILLAWVVGGVIALCGSRAYAAIAELVPRSGGEYRYLSELVHPLLGYLAGWASLLVGFAGPVAVDAYAAGVLIQKLVPGSHPLLTGALIIAGLVAFHSRNMAVSKATQNAMVALKVLLLVVFLVMGLGFGNTSLPAWEPPAPRDGFPLEAFASSLFFIAFAFAGWNAAAYAAEDFSEPRRQVPRSMLLGCGLVAVAYLLVNFVLVANITPEMAKVVFNYESERITLAHVVSSQIVGPSAAQLVSAAMALALISAASAMTFVGPRVYSAMARDGYLPAILVGSEGRPPIGSILLQGAVALLILFTHGLKDVLQNVGAILTFFSGLVALSLFYVRLFRPEWPKPAPAALLCAGAYVVAAAWMLYTGLRASSSFWLWSGAFLGLGTLAYVLTGRRRPSESRAAARPRD